MRSILWLSLFLLAIAGVVLPIGYLYVSSTLPQLESEFDLERYLRQYIEGERMALKMGRPSNKTDIAVTYEKPDFAKLPKDLVALYIAGMDCPTFFQTPRETGFAWNVRVFNSAVLNRQLPGDGRCEWAFANNLAWAIHVRGGLAQAIAASKIHSFLAKDQLVAYDLSALWFEPGVVGLEDATKNVVKAPMDQLRLEQMAEVNLVMPPHGFYGDMKFCKNASMIRQNRDFLLGRLAAIGLVPEDRARNAQAQPVTCTR